MIAPWIAAPLGSEIRDPSARRGTAVYFWRNESDTGAGFVLLLAVQTDFWISARTCEGAGMTVTFRVHKNPNIGEGVP